jgi:peroxiredoxin
MPRAFPIGIFLIVVGIIGCATAVGGTGDLKIGDNAPDFKNLPGTDDKNHSLADFKQDVLVFVITCNHCPVAGAYEERMMDFTKKYAIGKDAKVGLVAFNISSIDEDKLDKMKVRAKEKGFNFPYLYDQSQAIGKQLNAHVTPEFYVFDKSRKLVYWGAMDDNMNESKVKERYLEPAVDALLAGKTIPTAQTKAFGCPVKFDH